MVEAPPSRPTHSRTTERHAKLMAMKIKRNPTRSVRVGAIQIGGDAPIVVQSMAATKTQDIAATSRQVRLLEQAGADIVRIAVDSKKDVEALAEIRRGTDLPLSVDLQENYRLASLVAPHVDKLRYNPGHLHHHEKDKPIPEKVAFIARTAQEHDCAIRVGVNCGSVDPRMLERYEDQQQAIVASAVEHCEILDGLGFERYVVSLKDSDWQKVVAVNRLFAEQRPDVPLHLGVTEAGMPPDGVIKTRLAFEQLISQGVGDTVRVSLTVPFDDKGEEIAAARDILRDIEAGRFRSVPPSFGEGLNIISCPSCSRVENNRFVELAQEVKLVTEYAQQYDITIAVMGCRVNGPGETDDADLGLWCGPAAVNLKRGEETIGYFGYDEVLSRLKDELDAIIATRAD